MLHVEIELHILKMHIYIQHYFPEVLKKNLSLVYKKVLKIFHGFSGYMNIAVTVVADLPCDGFVEVCELLVCCCDCSPTIGRRQCF